MKLLLTMECKSAILSLYKFTNMYRKSDILRYEILRQFGGVYADVDYEWLQPIDTICSRCSFFAGLANTSVLEINNGLIG